MATGGADGENDDPMYDDAVRLVFEFGKASTSLLQRRLRIGYGRAAHLIDLMYNDGSGRSRRWIEATRDSQVTRLDQRGGCGDSLKLKMYASKRAKGPLYTSLGNAQVIGRSNISKG